MISVEEAQQLLAAYNFPLRKERIPLNACPDRVLAETIRATLDSPSYTNSAMDGFALRWEDMHQAGDETRTTFRICGESQAGIPFSGIIHPGQAIRISTGALLPQDADTVIPVEHTEVLDALVTVRGNHRAYQHVRYQGEEFKTGEILLHPGVRLQAAQIGLLASMGMANIEVFTKPRCALIMTGTELVPFDQQTASHELRDSNTPMLMAAIAEAGGYISNTYRVEDRLESTLAAIRDAESEADLILFSGGVSMGPHDHVKDAAQELGYSTLFWKVNQKPGKPLFAAQRDETLLIGLPGNPVSAYMCFFHYARPLIRNSVHREDHRPLLVARLNRQVLNNGPRTLLHRVRIADRNAELPVCEPLQDQGSHMLTSIAQADGYIVIPGHTALHAKQTVDVHLFK